MPLGAVFSDIDGTVVHYQTKLVSQGYEYLGEQPAGSASAANATSADVPCDAAVAALRAALPVHLWKHTATGAVVECCAVFSATLGGGFMSLKTLKLVDRLRAAGVKFVLLTGARTSTFVTRRDSGAVPTVDYGACENGGRLWDAARQPIDEWTDRFAAATGDWRGQTDMAAEQRVGPVWDVYRELLAEHTAAAPVKLDGKSFGTGFMVDVRENMAGVSGVDGVSSVGQREVAMKARFAGDFSTRFGVAMVVNLGKGHVAPIGCDKAGCTAFIAAREGIVLRDPAAAGGANVAAEARYAAALFDDENDLTFAELCRVGFAPSIAHPSVIDAIAANGERYQRPPVDGFLGTDYALEQLLALV
jgi:hydroxymethylpyrimidine pyrophosphatase-like HAD family hydrolase